MKKLSIGLLSLVCITSNSFAADKEFTYATNLLKAEDSCQETANDLALQIKSQGRDVVSAEGVCHEEFTKTIEGSTQTFFTILVNYTAKERSKITRVHFGTSVDSFMFGSTGNTDGAYSSYSACLSDLPSRVSEFESETGTKKLSATCMESRSSFATKKSFVLTIDGIGDAQKNLYVFQPDSIFEAQPEIMDRIVQFFRSQRARESMITLRGLYYYNDSRLNIKYDRLQMGSVKSDAQCLAQVQSLKEGYIRAINAHPYQLDIFCEPVLRNHPKGSQWMVRIAMGVNLFAAAFEKPSGLSGFQAFESCMNQKAIKISQYNLAHRDSKAFSAVCHESSSSFGDYPWELKLLVAAVKP